MKTKRLIILIIIGGLATTLLLITRNSSRNVFLQTPTDTDLSETVTPTKITELLEIETPTITATESENTYEIRTGEEIGERIIDAIDLYYAAFQTYPETLDDLVPDYLSDIPTTTTGREYSYSLQESEIYYLSFTRATRGENFGCLYMKRSNIWDCGRIAD